MGTIHNLYYSETSSCLKKLSLSFPVFSHHLQNLRQPSSSISQSEISDSSSHPPPDFSRHMLPAPPSPHLNPKPALRGRGERRHLICIICQFPWCEGAHPRQFQAMDVRSLLPRGCTTRTQESVLQPALAHRCSSLTSLPPQPGNI